MLENTFLHIQGVGPEAERLLWTQGCLTWSDYVEGAGRYKAGSVEHDRLLRAVRKSASSLAKGEHQYFRKGLGLRESWRAFPEFRHSCVFLDIETDGGFNGDAITMVGLYDGKDFKCLIRGEDLGNFPDVISQYSMVVTFFGDRFDLPMLRKRFPLIGMDQIHIDLCPTLRRLGYSGGLKKIEKQLGIDRQDGTAGLNGRDAIYLWRRYTQLRDDSALETLIAYNREDVVNLERLTEHAYEELRDTHSAHIGRHVFTSKAGSRS